MHPGFLLSEVFEVIHAPDAIRRDARESGVVFDVGHGCGSFSWDSARRAFEHHFFRTRSPAICTDFPSNEGCLNLATTMAKCLLLGMSIEEVALKTTWALAQAIGRDGEISTLRLGSAADIFVFSIEDGEFLLEDTHLKVAKRMIRPYLIVKSGKTIEPGSRQACLRQLQPCDLEVFLHIEESA